MEANYLCNSSNSSLTWVCPGSNFQCPEIYVCRWGSSFSFLSQSASYHCVFQSEEQRAATHSSGLHPSHFNLIKSPSKNLWLTHQLLHVASKVETCESFLLLGVILSSLLGLLLLLTSSLVLHYINPQPQTTTGDSVQAIQIVSKQHEHNFTSRRFCRSFSLSLRILCCSARSDRRFSCATNYNFVLQIFTLFVHWYIYASIVVL